MTYDMIKAFHIIAMVAWFAGLFYLPRLFVYHVGAPATAKPMLNIMEYKLYHYIMLPAMLTTWLLGILLVILNPSWLSMGWFHAKFMCVLILSGYHGSLNIYRKRLAADTNTHSEKFFRYYNEVPTILLIMIVVLVVLKPF
ncbi:MAG: protoporphyrinogen oxidase HemJ [Alphaproteobacteria bacterium]